MSDLRRGELGAGEVHEFEDLGGFVDSGLVPEFGIRGVSSLFSLCQEKQFAILHPGGQDEHHFLAVVIECVDSKLCGICIHFCPLM